MPNWCYNSVKITHKDSAMIERARKAFNDGRLLDEFIPVPQSLHIVEGRVGLDTDPKQIELAAQEKANREAYGYSTWYDFCVNEWGTKWDICNGVESDIPNGLQLGFDSAWSPPINAYYNLIEQGFEIEAMYYEPGMGFCGEFTTENGECEYVIEGCSTWVEENIPSHINEQFAISEQMELQETEDEDTALDVNNTGGKW